MTDDKEKLNLEDLTNTADMDDAGVGMAMEDSPQQSVDDLLSDDERHPVEQLEAIYNVPVQVSAVLGKTSMPISQLIRLGRGAILELDRKVGEPVDIVVNNRLVARGEVVVVDERIGITMTEIIKSEG